MLPIPKEKMEKFYLNPVYSDITLIVEGKEFPVSRLMLSLQSTFFETLFNSDFDDGQKKVLPLTDVKVRSFEIVLRFIYFGKLTLESTEMESVIELINLAHFFDMPLMVQQLEDQILKFPIVEYNVIYFFNVAALLGLENLLNKLNDYIFSHQKYFIDENIFVQFNEVALLKILESNEWTVEESTIAFRVANWLNINPTTKRQEILKKIRLPLIEVDLLVGKLFPKQLFNDDIIFNALVKRASNLPYNNYRKICTSFIKTAQSSLHYHYHFYSTTAEKVYSIQIIYNGQLSLRLSDTSGFFQLNPITNGICFMHFTSAQETSVITIETEFKSTIDPRSITFNCPSPLKKGL